MSLVSFARQNGWTVDGPGDDGMVVFRKGYLKIFVETVNGKLWSARYFHDGKLLTLTELQDILSH